MRHQTGFTLIEFTVTLLIGLLLVAAAGPTFSTIVTNNRMTSNANRFVQHLNFARSEAIKTRSSVSIAAKSGNTDWQPGWTVSVSGAVERDAVSLTPPLTFTANSAALQFRASGDLVGVTPVSFDLCETRNGEIGRRVTVQVTGRITVSSLTCT